MMLFTTFPQLIALLVLFVAGLIIGLGLHPGGAKWKKRFKDESDNYAAFRREADTAQRDSNQRIKTLEAELATAREQVSKTPDPSVRPVERVAGADDSHPDGWRSNPDSHVTTAAVAAAAPLQAGPDARPATGRDDLARIRGVDATLKTKLLAMGVTGFGDIETLTPEDEMALEQRLSLPAGYITREQWREQAHLLRTGQDAEQAERFRSN